MNGCPEPAPDWVSTLSETESLVDELQFDVGHVVSWFLPEKEVPYILVRISDEQVRTWVNALIAPVRRCYVTDAVLDERATTLGVPKQEVLAATLPDAGSTMAGDFGEILVYLYHAAREFPKIAVGPKKWRMKQDRTKPAPHSDVIYFVLPTWPTPSDQDVLLCSEVKTKSTNGTSTPLSSAIEDCAKDRTSRLSRTLVWLREKALLQDLGDVKLEHLNRFINATDHPPAVKRFHAVAVVCSSLLDAELVNAPAEATSEYTVIVIAVPQLQNIYTSVFEGVRQSVLTPAAGDGRHA